MAATRLATVTSSGIPVEYEAGEVRVGAEPSSLASVIEFDRIGALTWVSDEIRAWAHTHAGASSGEQLPAESVTAAPALVEPPQPSPVAEVASGAKDALSRAAAKVSSTAQAVADDAIEDAPRHSMPLWAKLGWALSMIANGVFLALAAYLSTRALDGIDAGGLLEGGYLKTSTILGFIGTAAAAIWQVVVWIGPWLAFALFVVSVIVLALPAYGMAHAAARSNRNKYVRGLIITVLLPLFALLLMPVLFIYSGLSVVIGIWLAG